MIEGDRFGFGQPHDRLERTIVVTIHSNIEIIKTVAVRYFVIKVKKGCVAWH